MGNFYAFHKSVRGYLHVVKNIPCEDYSESYADESGQFYIAVVADGHGDTACMRSADGAQIAAKVAKEQLSEFAKAALSQNADESIKEQLENGRQKDVLKPLTNNIVSEWVKQVDKHLESMPLTEENLSQAGRYADAYRKGQKLRHIYGTTLLAALMLPDYLILLQQGDGRCIIFYEDGTVSEPVVLDERCHENVTTSMCDEDVPVTLLEHSVLIPLHEKKVTACWLGCDGVEDSYRNEEGTYTFYRKLMCELNERKNQEKEDFEAFEAFFKEYLEEFSKIGSGDDVSVGGIVDMDWVKMSVPSFTIQAEEYDLLEKLEQLNNKHISMSNKHRLLKEEAENTQKLYAENTQKLYAEIQGIGDESNGINVSDSNNNIYHSAMKDAKAEFDAYDEKYKAIEQQIEETEIRLEKCREQRSQLAEQIAENEKKKRAAELPSTEMKSETTGCKDAKVCNETKAQPEQNDADEKVRSEMSGQLENPDGEAEGQRITIILLTVVLILALLVLFFQYFPVN